MASFTDNFFSNTKSTTTNKKKKDDDEELSTSFTSSFFNTTYDDNFKKNALNNSNKKYSYNDEEDVVYSEEFINEYNSFIDRMNKGAKERYDEQVAKTESAAMYYSANKNKLVEERNKNLIYNWNISNSGGIYFDYGSVPKQDKNGYLKKTDSNGNVYWVDIKNDLLYDSNYKLINDDRLKNEEFMNGLKYEYDKNNKLNSNYLSTQDKLGLNKIDESRYMSIVNNELYDTKKVDWNKNPTVNSIPEQMRYGNEHVKEGWIIDEGKYYKPVSNNLMDYKPDGKTIKIKDNKVYELVENETPKKLFEGTENIQIRKQDNGSFQSSTEDNKPFKIQQPNLNEPFKPNLQSPIETIDYNQLSADVYKKNFEKLNKAIEEGKLTTANNAIEIINEKYFGHKISDGYIDMLGGNTEKNIAWFSKKFADNVEELEVINNSIANTSDASVLDELNKEKDRLELENTLIQYNRILAQQSAMNKVNKIDKMYEPVDEAWNKVGKLWSSTFEEFNDGYQLGDLFGTVKNIFNNSVQSLGALGVQTNTGIQALINMGLSDMDDSEFKDKWLPAIVDVGTYIIPYVGQARFIINLAEPGAVAESWITQEGSATIESSDGDPRVASTWNGIGAIINIGANILSNEIFKGIRVRLGEEGTKKIYENTARGIATLIFKDAAGEGVEEFVQTYAEVLQNTENVGDIDWKQTTKEGLEAALIAFITSGLASGASIGIDTIRTGDIRGTMLSHAELNNNSQDGDIENVRLNKDLADNKKVVYSSTDTKGYNDIKPDGLRTSDVTVDTDEQVAIDIATELENNQIVTILNSDAITKDTNISLDDTSGTISLADSVIDNNTKYVLVGSKEMETYIKSLRPDLTTIVFDPNSKTFMDDVRAYVKDVAKTNIVPKNVKDFTVNDYKLSPTEVNDINTFVNESLNRGNFSDSINNPDLVKFDPIKTSDITDSDINTIMNTIKTKFLNEIDSNKITKETAQKEFKNLNERISDYVLKAKQDRTYLKDSKNNIIVFSKKGDNFYEAVNTLPKGTADLSLLANVKTNGNIINGNLSTKVEFAKKQLNAVNTLIDKLKLKGNYLTPDSTYKDVASLVKMNREFSGAILQALNADGLIEGQNKTRLYTAFNNLDNANMNQAIKNTSNYLKSESFNKELDKKVETTAPRTVDLKPEESKVSVEEKPISVEEYANNPENPSELNNIELEKLLDDSFKDLQIKNKLSKDNALELKNIVKNAIFDGYSHIADIANINNDYNVKNAIYNMQSVASDAQAMINGAQMKDGEVIGKALKQIYPDNNIKTKKDKELFEKIMLHALNAERENAGVDKIFENISAKQSEAIVKNAFEKHPNFKEAANDLQRYNNNLLNMLVDGGVISQELSNKLKNRYKYYMPIYSSDLSTFVDLDSGKYLKSLSLDNSIKDVTKTGKQILSLEKSMENKTYNVLSAIAKNKLAQEIRNSGKYEGDSDLLFYDNGQLTKTKVSKEILSDISNNKASHIADVIHDIPVLKQLIDLNNLSYKFILDPIYQMKNITIDFADSALIYSKDKAHFIPNYFKAIHAVANNSEAFHEVLANGLGNIGEGWNAPKISYDSDGNIITRQNKFQRIYANLEAMPKIAEYFSLKDKYMKQAKKDYDAGKYDKNNFNKSVVKNDDGSLKHVYHGTDNYGFTEFSKDYNDKNRAYSDSDTLVSFFSDRKENAQTYTKNKDNVYDVYLNIQKPLIVECDGKAWSALDSNSNPFKKTTTDEIIKAAIKSGKYDGVIFNNIQDRGPRFHGKLESHVANDYVVFDNSQIIQSHLYNKDNKLSFKTIQEDILNKAMLDASDVNLNFNRGGKVTKALSKSGFKFLNAGIQGFDKFVTHVGEGVKTPKGMGSLLLEFTAVGIGTAVANAILNGDDEEYDKLPYYYKNNYYMFKVGDNQYFRIPKGRVQALYNVIFEYATGLREEDSAKDYFDSLTSAFDSAVLPPALESASPISAYVQLFENKDAFGNEIYSKKYDTTEEKIQKSIYHLLSNYFGRYGRIVKDVTDGDSTTDLFNEFDFYKDTTKANKHYSTALSLVEYYQNADNVKTLDDKAIKKYIDTQNYALRSVNSEINKGKTSGLKTQDLKMKYAARDDILLSMINNHKNFDKEVDANGNTWYYFDEYTFMYNAKTHKFVKK